MASEHTFTLNLEHIEGYEFRLKFDWPDLPELTLDEPLPLGHQHGPNASRLLAASVANCLSASLFFCLSKSRTTPRGMKTAVTCNIARNEAGRMRIDRLDVAITLDTDTEQAARLQRCASLFEDYCVVTQSVRAGIPVHVTVANGAGEIFYQD